VGKTNDGVTLVTVLTPQARKAEDITTEKAEAERIAAEALPSNNPVERANRTRALERARGLAYVAAKNA
jgi:F-type H+-transporting ATPase subunit epsilon